MTRRRGITVAGAALVLLAQLAPVAVLADEAATRAVFETPYLETIEAPSTLRYTFAVNGKLVKAPASDTMRLEVKGARDDGTLETWLDLFSGEARRRFPGPSAGSSGNPLIPILFKRDAEALSLITGGSTTYFRNLVRAAFRGAAAKAEPVTAEVAGEAVAATKVTLRPYIDGKNAGRMGPFAGRSYEIVLAPGVPGGLVRFAALTPGEAAGDAPLLEEVLTYAGQSEGVDGGETP